MRTIKSVSNPVSREGVGEVAQELCGLYGGLRQVVQRRGETDFRRRLFEGSPGIGAVVKRVYGTCRTQTGCWWVVSVLRSHLEREADLWYRVHQPGQQSTPETRWSVGRLENDLAGIKRALSPALGLLQVYGARPLFGEF